MEDYETGSYFNPTPYTSLGWNSGCALGIDPTIVQNDERSFSVLGSEKAGCAAYRVWQK